MNSSLSKATRIALSHANVAENEKEWVRALRFYRTALRGEPKNPFLYYKIGALSFLIGSNMEALRSLKMSLKINPEDIEIMNLLGDVYGKLKNFEHAKEWYGKVLEIDPDDSHALSQLLSPHKTTQTSSSITIESTESENILESDLIHSIRKLATSYYNQGALAQSIVQWKRIIKINPRDTHALEEVAGNYNEMGKTDRALEYCHHIEALDPNNALVKLIRKDHESVSDTEESILEAHENSPEYQKIVQWKAKLTNSTKKVPILFEIATIYVDLDEKDMAIEYLEKIDSLDPDYVPGEKLFDRIMS